MVVGGMATNSYLVFDEETKEGMIIDPGDEGDYISEKVVENEVKLKAIVLTHGHFDHVLGILPVKLNFGAEICLNKADEFLYKQAGKSAKYWQGDSGDPLPPIDHYIKEGDEFKLSDEVFRVIETPGHTPGGICLINKSQGLLFCGDTLFKDGVGRTDFKYASLAKLQSSLKRLEELPGKWLVYPGHGEETGIIDGKVII